MFMQIEFAEVSVHVCEASLGVVPVAATGREPCQCFACVCKRRLMMPLPPVCFPLNETKCPEAFSLGTTCHTALGS